MNNYGVSIEGELMEIKKIKVNKPSLGIREITAQGGISLIEWKKISKKVVRLN
jgi:hypothetical protein